MDRCFLQEQVRHRKYHRRDCNFADVFLRPPYSRCPVCPPWVLSFLTFAYLVAAGPSMQLACTVLCPNTDLSLNTRTLSVSRLPPTRFLTVLFFFFSKSRSDPPQFIAGLPLSYYQHREAHGVHSTMHFRTAGTVTQSDRMMAESSVFIPAEQIQLKLVPRASNTTVTLVVPAKTKSKDIPVYQMSWLRPARVDASVRVTRMNVTSHSLPLFGPGLHAGSPVLSGLV